MLIVKFDILFSAKKCNPVEISRDTMSDQPSRPTNKGLVFDESIQLTPYATVTVYRCPDRMCGKPCVTLRAFKMHAKCVHKGIELTPVVQEAKANFICKVFMLIVPNMKPVSFTFVSSM